MTAAEVLALRRLFWQHGYRPLAVWNPDEHLNDKGEPLKNPGKQPRGTWRKDASENPPKATRLAPDPRALNTGILCGEVVAFDVDVLNGELVDHVIALIERTLDPSPLIRIGRAPKSLIVYRPEHPFPKMQTPDLFFADGSKGKVELLADGQHFVSDGLHPETRRPFRWTDRTPADVPVEQLPIVTEEQAQAIIAEAEALLRTAGAKEKDKPAPERPKPNGHDCGNNFFSQVNTAALSHIPAWAGTLFPKARIEKGTGAWRISSQGLGRDLEEDLSLHPDGIRDFGKEKPMSPIDVVLEHGSATTAVDAALWLCECIRIDPKSLGYRKLEQVRAKAPKPETNGKADPWKTPIDLICTRAAPGEIIDIPPRSWAYGKFLLFGYAGVIGAVDGAGKGAMAVVIALSMITGRPLLGEHVWRTGAVAVVSYEDDETEWRRRIAAACLHYKIDYQSVIESFYFIHRPDGRVCFVGQGKDGITFPDGDAIIHQLKAIGAVMLIVDPFNLAHMLDDGNNNVLIAKVAGEIGRCAKQSNTAALVLHHLRKGSTGEPDDLMGQQACEPPSDRAASWPV